MRNENGKLSKAMRGRLFIGKSNLTSKISHSKMNKREKKLIKENNY